MSPNDRNRVQVVLRSAQHEGEMLVSRAEARRIVRGLEGFEEVVLDFEGVAAVGPAFADELFRVFTAAHPHIRITPVNTAPAVNQMIRRATVAGDAQTGLGAQS